RRGGRRGGRGRRDAAEGEEVMRSISRALVLYSLALFALALGAVSLWSYRAYARSLEDQLTAQRELRKAQFKKDEEEIREKFDQKLLEQARIIRGQTAVQGYNRRLLAARASFFLADLAGAAVAP